MTYPTPSRFYRPQQEQYHRKLSSRTKTQETKEAATNYTGNPYLKSDSCHQLLSISVSTSVYVCLARQTLASHHKFVLSNQPSPTILSTLHIRPSPRVSTAVRPQILSTPPRLSGPRNSLSRYNPAYAQRTHDAAGTRTFSTLVATIKRTREHQARKP